jgi:hypothetical protein
MIFYTRTNWKRLGRKTIYAIGIFAPCLLAQVEAAHPNEAVSNLSAEAFACSSDQPGKGRIDIYVQVPYIDVKFVKDEERYTGRFEISATVLTQEKQQLWQKIQLVELHLKDFSQTVSDRFFSLKQFSADLAPGNYELLLQVTDQESKKAEHYNRSIIVKDFANDTLAMSDVMLVHRLSSNGVRKSIVPNLTGIIRKEETTFFLYFEVYNRSQFDSVQLTCKFINPKHEVVAALEKYEVLSGNRTQVIWEIDTLSLDPDR